LLLADFLALAGVHMIGDVSWVLSNGWNSLLAVL
jgi:hypothetical protein